MHCVLRMVADSGCSEARQVQQSANDMRCFVGMAELLRTWARTRSVRLGCALQRSCLAELASSRDDNRWLSR